MNLILPWRETISLAAGPSHDSLFEHPREVPPMAHCHPLLFRAHHISISFPPPYSWPVPCIHSPNLFEHLSSLGSVTPPAALVSSISRLRPFRFFLASPSHPRRSCVFSFPWPTHAPFLFPLPHLTSPDSAHCLDIPSNSIHSFSFLPFPLSSPTSLSLLHSLHTRTHHNFIAISLVVNCKASSSLVQTSS